jgi:hypothetical protein
VEDRAAVGARDLARLEILVLDGRHDHAAARTEQAPDLRQCRLDLIVEQMLDHLYQEHPVERRVLQRARERLGNLDSLKQRLSLEPRLRLGRRRALELEPRRGHTTGKKMGEEIASPTTEIQHLPAAEPDLALDALDDRAARVRAEVLAAIGRVRGVVPPHPADLLLGPVDLVRLVCGLAQTTASRHPNAGASTSSSST